MKLFHTYGLCPVRGLNLGRSGVKQSEREVEHVDPIYRGNPPYARVEPLTKQTCIEADRGPKFSSRYTNKLSVLELVCGLK